MQTKKPKESKQHTNTEVADREGSPTDGWLKVVLEEFEWNLPPHATH